MTPPALTTLHFRDAVLEDLEALTAIKSCEAVHHDRIIDARSSSFSYLVVERNRQVVGFACLVFTRPASWSDSHDTNHLPQIVDIQINPTLRGQGFGSFLIRGLEALATEKGCEQIYLAVDPVNNPRAHTLYQRLGYQQIQPEPYRKLWSLVDSQGGFHTGDNWIVDMVKKLH